MCVAPPSRQRPDADTTRCRPRSRWFAWPCIADTQKWHPWLNQHQDAHSVKIGFDSLSLEYRAWLAALDAELAAGESA